MQAARYQFVCQREINILLLPQYFHPAVIFIFSNNKVSSQLTPGLSRLASLLMEFCERRESCTQQLSWLVLLTGNAVVTSRCHQYSAWQNTEHTQPSQPSRACQKVLTDLPASPSECSCQTRPDHNSHPTCGCMLCAAVHTGPIEGDTPSYPVSYSVFKPSRMKAGSILSSAELEH